MTGRAERLTGQQDIDQTMHLIKERNPTLKPAINTTWIDAWGRGNIIAIYRTYPSDITGNQASG